MLQSFDSATKFLDLNTLIVKNEGNPVTIGWYKIVNGMICAFYVRNNNLMLKYGENDFLISSSSKAKSILINDNFYAFRLFEESKVIFEFLYEANKSLFNLEPFDYLDEEDFDWGLFLSNIINDPERKERILLQMGGKKCDYPYFNIQSISPSS